ncbi:MAG: TonB C-terminal domain-containing protein [Syntrophales bacterium LBB04]|nr:TonB C-terminal domain-containing protein [Syntrophales bacterium LBB04]
MIYQGGGAQDRRGLSFNGLIFVSLFAHLLILSLLVFSPSLLPAPKWTFGPVYSVQLVSMPEGLPEKRSGDASYGEIMNVSPSGQSALKKESLGATPGVPIVPMEVRKKSTDSIDNALEAIRKNVSSAKTPTLTALPKTEASAPASSSGKQSDAELAGKLSNYYALIKSRIKSAWTLPQGILPRENIEAVIQVRILRDGSVSNVGFEKRTGNRYYDESALRTVKKASPFPPLPDGVKENSIDLGIIFNSSEFR